MIRVGVLLMPAVFAIYMPSCVPPKVRPTMPVEQAHLSELWEAPDDLSSRDLFYGPWGETYAPDPQVTYSFAKAKDHGTNPGMTVRDPLGNKWHVKQPPRNDEGAEGPVEVVLSRVLSAVGYHQPPVYFLPSFTVADDTGAHVVPGGRFRLDQPEFRNVGTWSWQENPFVGTPPYQGLLVILMVFDSSDIKNDNNTVYELSDPRDGLARWYVVRDLGTALGETGRLKPKRSDPYLFERQRFISRVSDGFVEFSYHGWHQELFKNRITPRDVRWASRLLKRLTDSQWADAFRAGGYGSADASRFIRRLQQKIAEGEALAE
jgi:hypothetical protein